MEYIALLTGLNRLAKWLFRLIGRIAGVVGIVFVVDIASMWVYGGEAPIGPRLLTLGTTIVEWGKLAFGWVMGAAQWIAGFVN